MKISKLIMSFGIALVIIMFSVQLCEAANTLTCWYAYNNDGTQTTKGYYLTSNFVGKVVESQNVSSREAAATALVNGMVPWNNNNKALNQLGVSLRSIPYSSTTTYNVEFLAGDALYIQYCFGTLSASAVGKTQRGDVSNRRAISYNSVTREVFSYSANSSTSSNLTKVGIVTDRLSSDKYGIVGAHEIGHVLGWYGHAASTSALMHFSGNGITNYTVTTTDLAHIKQFYELEN